jgi:WD40 repeat protein
MTIAGHCDLIYSCKFLNDGEQFVTCSHDGSAKIWQMNPKGGPYFSILCVHTQVTWPIACLLFSQQQFRRNQNDLLFQKYRNRR